MMSLSEIVSLAQAGDMPSREAWVTIITKSPKQHLTSP
jgi:hypothetical protein